MAEPRTRRAAPRMRIGELAEATGTTPRALRHYEQAGLIASERAANGYRLYDAGTAVRVRNIRQLLDVGLTLDDAQVFLPCLDGDVTAGPASEKGLRVAADRLAVLEARIAAQMAVRDRLASALREATATAVRPAAARHEPGAPSVQTAADRHEPGAPSVQTAADRHEPGAPPVRPPRDRHRSTGVPVQPATDRHQTVVDPPAPPATSRHQSTGAPLQPAAARHQTVDPPAPPATSRHQSTGAQLQPATDRHPATGGRVQPVA